METDYEESLKQKIDETFRCRNCNYCYSRCPLSECGDGFMTEGPSGITQSLYYAIKWNLKEEEELSRIVSKCTTCNSCVLACKELAAGVPLLDIIESGRALLVERGSGPTETQAETLEHMYERGNSYGENPIKRKEWLKIIGIPEKPESGYNTLLYLGCSVSYDPELRKIAEALVKIFKHAGVTFSIAYDEPCCGCLAKRLGDLMLFDEISKKNTQYLKKLDVKTIITISPHAYNTFLNEYPMNNHPRVMHYTQFLHDMIQTGKITFTHSIDKIITYHDPCYLGKHNGIYEEPREVIRSIPGVKLTEMECNRSLSLCCGGGGGGMWLETEDKKHRPSTKRLKQAKKSGAQILAVACPWCHSMLGEEAKSEPEETIIVTDIAQLVAQAIG